MMQLSGNCYKPWLYTPEPKWPNPGENLSLHQLCPKPAFLKLCSVEPELLKIFSGIVPKAQPAALTFDPVEGQAGKEQKCQLSKQHSCFHLLSGPREGGKSFVKEGSQELLPITQITSKENLSQKVGKESGSFPPSKIRNQQNTYVPCKHPHNLPHICFFQYLGWAG